MTRAKPAGVSPYRAFIHAIGAGSSRGSGSQDALLKRPTMAGNACWNTARFPCPPQCRGPGDSFGYAYIPYLCGLAAKFDRSCKAIIEDNR
jgi:chloramphenicol O-acetyltransferase type A